MKIRSVIIEDEQKNRDNIKALLAEYCPEIDLVGEADSVGDALKLVKKIAPDLLFLDIELPDGNAFDLLETLNQDDFEVVFVTAYGHYAIKAIKFCALDFILKPINIYELTKAVQKSKERIDKKNENKRLRELLNNIARTKKQKQIVLPVGNQLEFIRVNEIVSLHADNNYTIFKLNNGKEMLVCKTLGEYESLLTDYGFLRTHQSHIVNISMIKTLVKSDGGYLLLNNKTTIPISRNRKQFVVDFLAGKI
ncbi:MAG: LytTR family DNA-binding domain-containing protein [Bacteroidales bacterium]|nr:LytTR family DNA-binding domain-containing protein [Bacteroidales bacterium]